MIVQLPRGSVGRIWYPAEYVPAVEVCGSVIIPPVGLFAVTEAPETGFPPDVTEAAIVAVSPRLNAAPEAGLEIVTENACAKADCAIKAVATPVTSNSRTNSEARRDGFTLNVVTLWRLYIYSVTSRNEISR